MSTWAPRILVSTLENSPNDGADDAEVRPAAGPGRRQQQPQHPPVEEPAQPRRARPGSPAPTGTAGCRRRSGPTRRAARAAGRASPSPCTPACRRRSERQRLVERVGEDLLGPLRRRCARRTTSSKVRFMSSIIACSAPPLAASTPATGRGVLSSSVRPSDWASRRAGSMVSTTTVPAGARRPAAPSAAAVVVLPTPPEPQQTTIRVAGSARSASTSSVERRRGRAGAAWSSRRHPARRSSSASSYSAAEVDPARPAHGSSIRRPAERGQRVARSRPRARPGSAWSARLGEPAPASVARRPCSPAAARPAGSSAASSRPPAAAASAARRSSGVGGPC